VIRSAGVVETRAMIDETVDERRLSPLVFLRPGPLTRVEGALVEFAEQFRRRAATLSGLRALSSAVLERLPFLPGVTAVHSTAYEAFEAGNGVCQDHAHVFIAAARHLGFPARYVSGYLLLDGQAAQVASHAWSEAHVEGLGWVGFDAANGISPDTRYVRLATGRDYRDAMPVSGIILGTAAERLAVRITVEQ
jgi:transglutaminase-like putative cysteine protease